MFPALFGSIFFSILLAYDTHKQVKKILELGKVGKYNKTLNKSISAPMRRKKTMQLTKNNISNKLRKQISKKVYI